jgi:prephenate dehydrogenase
MAEWRKVALIGVGLLGGSLGLALKDRKLARRVEGFVRRPASVLECQKLGVVDAAHLDLAATVRDADLIVFCTPIAQMGALAKSMRPHVAPQALVTDVGSVKAAVVTELEPLFPLFVGSHPMAGSEKTGPSAATANLYIGAVCVVTPTARSNAQAVARLEELWRSVGATTRRLTPEAHDELVSRSSHLPHLLAAQLVNYVLGADRPKDQAVLCANGFRDTTRIASGSPEMWRDIALSNREHLARELNEFIEALQEVRAALEKGDSRQIEQFFAEAKKRRDAWHGQRGLSPE